MKQIQAVDAVFGRTPTSPEKWESFRNFVIQNSQETGNNDLRGQHGSKGFKRGQVGGIDPLERRDGDWMKRNDVRLRRAGLASAFPLLAWLPSPKR
jgi:hypothetical protein